MRFIIRDDDTNYFTQPQELEFVYGGLWDKIPISLSVIPFVSGNYLAGRENCDNLPTKQDKLNYVKSIEGVHSVGIKSLGISVCPNENFEIGENRELVAFLRRLVDSGKVCLLLHGFSHRSFPEGYEFEVGTDTNLKKKVAKGKQYLEDVFGVRIKTFVAPHNALSVNGVSAVSANGMNILGPLPFISNISSPIAFYSFIKRAGFKLRHGIRAQNPFIRDYKGFKSFPCNRLGYSTTFEQLKDAIDFAAKLDGNFCVETHYYALYESEPMRSILHKLIEYVEERYGTRVCFVTGDEVFEK